MESNESIKCDYGKHGNNQIKNSYYCDNCKLMICSNCLEKHNSDSKLATHKYFSLKDILENAKNRKNKIESEPFMNNKDILNANEKDDINFANNRISNYLKVLNNLNNLFRNENNKYINQFQTYADQLKKFKENIKKTESNPLLLIRLMSEDYQNINGAYKDLISKNKKINYLFDSTSELYNKFNDKYLNKDKKIIYEKINNNNFSISGVIIPNNAKGVINKVENKTNKIIGDNKNKIKFNIEKKEKNENMKNIEILENLNNKQNNKEEKKEDIKKINVQKPQKIQNEQEKKNINENININKKEKINTIQTDDNSEKKLSKVNKQIKVENKNNNQREINNNKDLKLNIKRNGNDKKEKKEMSENESQSEKDNKMKKYSEIDNNQKEIMEDEKSLNKNCLFLNIINKFKKEDPNFSNRKTKRTEVNENNKESFLNNIFNQNNKKQKTDNLNNSNNFLDSSSIKILEEQKNDPSFINNNNLFITTINSYNKNIIINNNISQKKFKSKYFFGLYITKKTEDNKTENERGLIVFESKKNERAIIRKFNSNQIIHEKIYIHSSEFPYEFSKLININNEAYLIGGITNNDINYLGNTFCFKINLIYNNNTINNNNLCQIKCSSMKNTIYRHQSHSVLYSKLYNAIIVLSGYEQTKCEYAKLNEKNEINGWEELIPLKSPRENPLSFLLNDKYIFLIGGKNNLINNSNYDYFDFSLVMDNKMPYWSNYSIKIDENNELMFNSKGSGIVEINNTIYVLGGHINCSDSEKKGKDNNNFMAWKIKFGNNNRKYIEKIDKFEVNQIPKYRDGYSFYGQPKFMICDDYYVNITIGGKCESIPRWIFNQNN